MQLLTVTGFGGCAPVFGSVPALVSWVVISHCPG
jgi:hypothetical protein